MKTYKIVFTGGPNGGKTKIIERIESFLKDLNYNVIIVSETAREIIASGTKAKPNDKEYTLKFQDLILKLQNAKELKAEIDSKKVNKDTIIIYDRSILDNSAYLYSQKDYRYLLAKNNIQELKTTDKYDLIINLSSLANFENFEYENDPERTEERATSKILDFKTSTAYLLSRNIKLIYPTENIDEKYKLVENHIVELLNHKETKETFKYDVDIDNSNFNYFNEENSKTLYITDYYLSTELNDINYKISKRTYNNETNYILTKSKEKDNITTTHDSKVISKEEFKRLTKKYKINEIEKKYEITFIYDFKRYKLIFDNNFNCTLEIEKSNFLSDIKIPNNIILKNNLEKIKKYGSI